MALYIMSKGKRNVRDEDHNIKSDENNQVHQDIQNESSDGFTEKYESLQNEMEELKNKNESYRQKIIDDQSLVKELEDKVSRALEIIQRYESEIVGLKLESKSKEESRIKEDSSRLFKIINLIKIIKDKTSHKETVESMNLFEKSMMKELDVRGIHMKEFRIGDNFYNLSDEDQNLCEAIPVSDPELENGYIKEIISNAFIHGEKITHAQIFVVKND